ncbi:MAG: hypothetical protein B5M53_09490 [Candidatus Cloacimonas sp. 4484_209]|nr:MAG: hypothetical protein B5M53_09490 [Candidatus Cloacimonas sp. 4484_209]
MKKIKGFNPKYISWISIILALLMITTAFLVIRRIELSMLHILKKEGFALLGSMITSSENSIKATNITDELIEEQLVENAKAVDLMGKLDKEKLLTIANEMHLMRIDVYNLHKKLILSSSMYKGKNLKPPSSLQFIFSRRSKIMSFKTDEGNFGVALKRLNSSDIIVCYADSKYISSFKQSIGIGNLIQKISREAGIEYVLLQNEEGIVFATKNIEKMKKISKDPFLKNALLSNKEDSRELIFDGRKVLEVVKPFSIDNTPYGIFRLGLSLDDYNTVLSDTKKHIVILSLFLFLIGFSLSENLVGRNYNLFFPEDEILLQKSLQLKKSIDEVEKEYILPSGRKKPLGITTSLLTDDKGNIIGATALVRDLTLIKKLKSEAEEKDRLKTIGELAAGVAHEIRNPLNALRLSIEKLKSEAKKEDTLKLLKIISEEIERIEKTVGDFLSFTKPFQLSFKPLKLNPILEETISLLQEKAFGRGIMIKKEFSLLSPIMGDETALRKVFMNLLRNSIEAITNAGEIVVKTYKLKDGINVSIKDNGEGMDETNIENIFVPYYSKKKGGTGLGMSIAKRIVESHNGSIYVKSKKGEGTEIIVTFPVAEKLEQK